MTDRDQPMYPDEQVTDNGNSYQFTRLPPVRRFSAIAPKHPESSLPGVGEIASIGEALRDPIRHHSISARAPPELFIPGVSVAYLDGLPLKKYRIVDQVYEMQKPENEGTNESTRKTCDGRLLKYILNVLQQPARARACGNGPRASSDRRPVDPPPVVQLKVYDMTDGEKDVTMSYDSGFMLYASLEVARPIAHGRMQAPTHPPVLTGVAVASAAYLERPNGPSGYFIFPDLSVRHEGWYRLKFSLFEAVKYEHDADIDRPFDHSALMDSTQPVKHQAMANRLEVSSTPFQVFSAKKFPGLDSSTEVSRTLAEQGCRVRIRREIRQRKRVADDKAKGEQSSRAGSDLYEIQQHTRTPSLDSQYQDIRRGSSDSHYSRPGPSRQVSIASMTQPSPTTPSYSQMPMGPPPTQIQRPSWDAAFMSSGQGSAARYPPNWSTSQSAAPSQVLPPLNMMPPSNPRSVLYELPQPTSQKRSGSPAQYSENDAMKHGARPDKVPTEQWSAPRPGEPIEAGDDDDDDENDNYGDLWRFRRAEGLRHEFKDPRVPSGMERILRKDG